MAKQERDREDLMREATALVERAEFNVAGRDEPVVAGFWRDGRFSIYFGGDPVYQFASEGGLRKAFVAGKIYRSSRAGLAELTRRRAAEMTSELVRRDLSNDETERFLTSMHEELRALDAALSGSAVQVVREHPPGAGVADKVRRFVQSLVARPVQVAPPVGRR